MLAGLGFFAVLALALWGVAAVIAHNGDQTTENLTPSVQEMGNRESLAKVIAKDGPIILNDLIGNDSHVVLDHVGDDPDQGWALYLAHPADRTFACPIEVVRQTHTFTDCEDRVLTVDQLAPPPKGVGPILNKDGSLSLDLTPSTA